MHSLDCRGLACPQPVIRCRDFLESSRPRHCEILVDNDAAATNVGRFLEQRGFAVSVARERDDLWRLHASRPNVADAPQTPQAPQGAAAPAAPLAEQARTLVFLTTETLGRGDDTLGEKLMATFLATLPEMGDSLWRLVLLNGGVRLSATPGPALDALRALEQHGVSILVCGTCLAHYGLADAKAVGQTSNMLDIVTSLMLADKVIRP